MGKAALLKLKDILRVNVNKSTIRRTFSSCNLELRTMTLIYELNPDIVIWTIMQNLRRLIMTSLVLRILHVAWSLFQFLSKNKHTTTHYRFTALFPGPPGWTGARRKLLDFMVQGNINRGRYTDHTAGRHSIRTNHCAVPTSTMALSSPFFTGRMPFLPPNQQCQSTEGNWRKTNICSLLAM